MMKSSKDRARKLRKNLTEAEQKMWFHLRKRRFFGIKFRRQVPIGDYIVDFMSCEARLIIEIDGSQHQEGVEYDEARTNYLFKKGFRVFRYWNNEIFENIDLVLEDISFQLNAKKTLPDRKSTSKG